MKINIPLFQLVVTAIPLIAFSSVASAGSRGVANFAETCANPTDGQTVVACLAWADEKGLLDENLLAAYDATDDEAIEVFGRAVVNLGIGSDDAPVAKPWYQSMMDGCSAASGPSTTGGGFWYWFGYGLCTKTSV